ncbi:hypothetical protein GDO81_014288 [Engystomops pustulosus]|uniref:NADH dehydrogenase subunit 6 n=1 Tax=Engystomops pustulosus TaxID=76066 RepID=A0AAV7B9T9_ENGPU|nr:hypothetical protein GDO81_014288 [Engystomops pustulosus]
MVIILSVTHLGSSYLYPRFIQSPSLVSGVLFIIWDITPSDKSQALLPTSRYGSDLIENSLHISHSIKNILLSFYLFTVFVTLTFVMILRGGL